MTTPAVPDIYDGQSDNRRSVMSPEDASIVAEAMRANVSGEVKDAFGINYKVPGYDTAGKSGTNECKTFLATNEPETTCYTTTLLTLLPLLMALKTLSTREILEGWGDHVVGNTGRDTSKEKS